jgi:hypothetical protein
MRPPTAGYARSRSGPRVSIERPLHPDPGGSASALVWATAVGIEAQYTQTVEPSGMT